MSPLGSLPPEHGVPWCSPRVRRGVCTAQAAGGSGAAHPPCELGELLGARAWWRLILGQLWGHSPLLPWGIVLPLLPSAPQGFALGAAGSTITAQSPLIVWVWAWVFLYKTPGFTIVGNLPA